MGTTTPWAVVCYLYGFNVEMDIIIDIMSNRVTRAYVKYGKKVCNTFFKVPFKLSSLVVAMIYLSHFHPL